MTNEVKNTFYIEPRLGFSTPGFQVNKAALAYELCVGYLVTGRFNLSLTYHQANFSVQKVGYKVAALEAGFAYEFGF